LAQEAAGSRVRTASGVVSEASSPFLPQSVGELISRFLPFGVRAVRSVLDRLRLRALLKANGAHIQ
jgi:hypothetical protein